MLQVRIFCKRASLTEQIQVEVNRWIEGHGNIEIVDKEIRIHKLDSGDEEMYIFIWYEVLNELKV